MPEAARLVRPAHVPVLLLALALEHPVLVALADLHVPAALRRPLEMRHVRRAHLPEAVADARSIRRPKKVR